MEVVRGQVQKNDQVVIEDVEIYLDIQATGPLKSWNAHFDLEESVPDLMSGQFRLVLQDGREGDFFVANLSIGSEGITGVDCQGSGPLD